MHAVVPTIEFPPAGTDMEFRLYHRVVEIRDGALALARYVSPDVSTWLREAGLDAESDDDRAVITEAATLAVALEARATGREFDVDSVSDQHVLAADIGAETAWLVRVAEAFTYAPVVDRVRQRARQQLAVTGHESRAE